MPYHFIILLFLLLHPAHAYEIAGIHIPDKTTLEGHDSPLTLIGAGTRKKYLFDIYIGALYANTDVSMEHAILCSDTPKRIALYFLYDEVSREKLQEGWLDGFNLNNSSKMLSRLKDRLNSSLNKFISMKSGDVIFFDYLPDTGTRIIINQQEKGIIKGFDFMQAVLKVWIGTNPAQKSLKYSMLGKSD